jgi:hypothetical protein
MIAPPSGRARRLEEGPMRSLRHIFAVAAAVALLTFAASSSALATNAKSIYAEKECSGLMATHSCIVTFSTFRTLRGADWHYQDLSRLALEPGSPMLLTTADTNGIRAGTATGVCHFVAPVGHCEWSGGTGSLRGFHANFAVGVVRPGLLSLTGTYWFDRGNGDDDEDED